jgi:hypothetical protein
MFLTPTAVGALLAGAVVWLMFWITLQKLGVIPFVKNILDTNRIFTWIRQNQIFCLLVSEIVNFAFHGIGSPLGVLFAAGGTLVNAFFILVYIPGREEAHRLMRNWQVVPVAASAVAA